MRRRILRSTLVVVLVTTLLLGVPLIITTRRLVEDITRADLAARLDRVSADLVDQETTDGRLAGPLDTDRIRLAVPANARLTLTYLDSGGVLRTSILGRDRLGDVITKDLDTGLGGNLVLAVPAGAVRTTQLQATALILAIMIATVLAGGFASGLTARRLADPLQDLEQRAARLGAGDFRPAPRRYGVAELDRVSDVLDSSAEDLAALLQRERELVGDLSHQLRSRLTAVRLRLDELSEHDDPAVVEEAEAAMDQVDRLSTAVDEMVAASRSDRTSGVPALDVVAELRTVVEEWQPLYDRQGRGLRLDSEPTLVARATAARLREAVVVLVENALVHGGGAVTVTATRSMARLAATPGAQVPTILIEVADSGQGVPPELVGRIFERGFSGAASSGVGLALARAMVETDGGRLELRRARPALFAIFLTDADSGPAAPSVVREPR
ncbi:MAG: HAMP domain-containing sensor histidine kinase [Mycobacteriaceae bacterium]